MATRGRRPTGRRRASSGNTVNVYGLEELRSSLATLERKVANKVIHHSLRAGMGLILAEAKARAPVGTVPHKFKEHGAWITVKPGNLRKMLKMRPRTGKKATIGKIQYIIPLDGRAFYGKFIEWGWKTKSGTYIQPKVRFLEGAFNAQKDAAFDMVSIKMSELFEQAAREAAANAR